MEEQNAELAKELLNHVKANVCHAHFLSSINDLIDQYFSLLNVHNCQLSASLSPVQTDRHGE